MNRPDADDRRPAADQAGGAERAQRSGPGGHGGSAQRSGPGATADRAGTAAQLSAATGRARRLSPARRTRRAGWKGLARQITRIRRAGRTGTSPGGKRRGGS